jgi:hypothetical protein
MPQPAFLTSAGKFIANFGGLALPNGQGALSNINLNDRVNTFAFFGGGIQSEDDNVERGFARVPYLAKGLWTYDDFGQRVIGIPSYYIEDGTHFLGQFLAALSQAGEQQLTFDNLTYIPCKYAGTSGRTFELGSKPVWFYTLNFLARAPWFSDISATTATPANPITTDAGQNFNVTYSGSVWCEPVWTLHIPNTNAVALNSFQIKNTMSGEFLTVNFQSATAIPASTTRDVVIDCAAMTAICTQTGESYDFSGSFPMLYGPAGQVNPLTVIVTPASGSSSGLTVAYSIHPRWQI